MLIVQPKSVRFGAAVLEEVLLVAVDREAEEPVEAWDDAGPFATLVDVPRQRVKVRLVQTLRRDEPAAPTPGTLAELAFVAAPGGSDAGRVRYRVWAVVTGVKHNLRAGAGAGFGGAAAVAQREWEFIAQASGAGTDPVTREAL